MKINFLEDYIAVGKVVCGQPRHYNGFPHAVRQLVNIPQRDHRRFSPHKNPLVCDITGFSAPDDPKGKGYMYAHLENYEVATCLDWLPCSIIAHRTLHARFVRPKAWFDMVARHYVHGAWWTMLCMSPVKMFVRPSPDGGIMAPYWSIYPLGLPKPGVPTKEWQDYATKAGISRDLFLANDVRETIRYFWSFPGADAATLPDISPLTAISPPPRRRPAPQGTLFA